ncbi:hypothetical protein CI109_104458 [Kwoniella shandongensis]|uniref:Uncharacterized protein n=1 Tax=Kwoniella shandongensis TaxID=1734106 RepID=A0A5M6BQY6_9TREE|nr:uncharacterized protein CI109_007308 [Kwoniella shandongensis]KAA5524360.1 hypothetical protein CI109_007308 [Kwoniella shandongensis]
MGRSTPSRAQDFLSSLILPYLSIFLLPVSITAVILSLLLEKLRVLTSQQLERGTSSKDVKGCVIISGGRMSKGLTLARAFKRAGWKVIGVEEEGWGDLCPMRFSSCVDQFYLLPPAAQSYDRYSDKLLHIAQRHSATLFIPVSGAGSSVEDARAAEEMARVTKGRCRTFIQDPETMLDLHDKDRFMALVDKLGFSIPKGKMVESVNAAIEFLREDGKEPKYILKCMGLDENRGDMTLFPLKGDGDELKKTRALLQGLRLPITRDCPYVFQEFIPGQEWCTHASVVESQITSFVTCPSNDMLMSYENATTTKIGKQAERWTSDFLQRLRDDPAPSGERRRLNGHFSFDFIMSTKDGKLYPLECNARVHTAVILLPLDGIAGCYSTDVSNHTILRPPSSTLPRSWLYNDLIMRYLPLLIPSKHILSLIHPSLPACLVTKPSKRMPSEEPFQIRVDPTLIADDWLPFLILWHVWWPSILLTRWWKGKKWTRLNVSTGRIFEA